MMNMRLPLKSKPPELSQKQVQSLFTKLSKHTATNIAPYGQLSSEVMCIEFTPKIVVSETGSPLISTSFLPIVKECEAKASTSLYITAMHKVLPSTTTLSEEEYVLLCAEILCGGRDEIIVFGNNALKFFVPTAELSTNKVTQYKCSFYPGKNIAIYALEHPENTSASHFIKSFTSTLKKISALRSKPKPLKLTTTKRKIRSKPAQVIQPKLTPGEIPILADNRSLF